MLFLLRALFITRVTTRSTFPIALPSTVPTARPTCLALRVVLAGTEAAVFDLRTTFLTTFCTFVAVAPAAAFVLRLMTWATGPTFRRREDPLLAGFLVVRVVFLAVVFFKLSPF